jgi:hypothetical protein
MDLARAPLRTARKKGSGYENVFATNALKATDWLSLSLQSTKD